MPSARDRERGDRRDSRSRDYAGRDDYYDGGDYYDDRRHYNDSRRETEYTYGDESRSHGYRPRESEYTYGESRPRGYKPRDSEYTYGDSGYTYEPRGRDERDRTYDDRGKYSVYRSRRRSPSPSSYTDSTQSSRTDRKKAPLMVVKKVQKVAHIQQLPPVPGVVNLPPPQIMMSQAPPPDAKLQQQQWEANLSIMGTDAAPAVLDSFHATATKAAAKFLQEDDVSGYIKTEMDRQFGRPWCCIYGGHFDSFITHDEGMFIYFKLQGKHGLLWRNRHKI